MAIWPGQLADRFGREDIGHVAHALVAVDLAAVAGGDPGAFLPAMLQRVQAQVSQVGGFRMAVDGKHAAFVVKAVDGCLRLSHCSEAGVLARFPKVLEAPSTRNRSKSRTGSQSVTALSL